MRKFILQPIPEHLDKDLWDRSGYYASVIVRAENAQDARQYVADKMDPMTPQVVTTKKSPWLDEYLTSCEVFTGDLYPDEGDPGILHPDALRDA